ncbi:MAG TPA: hypothetical protein VJ020_00380 [Anaerolineales bacterium]|nr:hypothetical protein [Anaerolineales bacterium]
MESALAKKLQLKPGQKMIVFNAPAGYFDQLKAALKDNALTNRARASGQAEAVLLFAANVAGLNQHAAKTVAAVPPDGLLWIAYPKGTSKIKTDLNRDKGWDVIHKAKLEGVRLIALDETWSVMRLRPKDRK